MKIYLGAILALFLFLAGCANNETVTVEGKIHQVKEKENTLVVYIRDTLTEKQKQRQSYDEDDRVIEAFLAQTDKETKVEGEVSSFKGLKRQQKVKVEIKGNYEEELVTVKALFDQHEELPVYEAETVTVVPYSKEDLVEDMTVKKGTYGLYIYDQEPNEDGSYGSYPEFIDNDLFKRIAMKFSVSEVKNTEELLGLHEDSPTYIVTDHQGIIFKTNNVKELKEFVGTLEKKK